MELSIFSTMVYTGGEMANIFGEKMLIFIRWYLTDCKFKLYLGCDVLSLIFNVDLYFSSVR